MANDQTVYLEQQNVRRGKAGYKNLPPNAKVVKPGEKPVQAAKVISTEADESDETRSERRSRRDRE